MRTGDFDFDLPAELIAQQPAEPRDGARLMRIRRTAPGVVEHRVFRELNGILRRGDLLVVNDTRVMAARLLGRRPETGGAVEALLVRPLGAERWEVMLRPGRQAEPGRRLVFDASDGPLRAVVLDRKEGIVELQFERWFDPALAGHVPLPPYIKGYRGDPERYQTVYSREARSAAAPTAGLHFTAELLDVLASAGVGRAAVTLEVGPGTFKPVTADDPKDHPLHGELVAVSEEAALAIREAKEEGRRVVAVGTTVVRTLEHVARVCGRVEAYHGETHLKILPGDEFRVVDALITNFHLPRSTLLMLVCAFGGTGPVLAAYAEAVASKYRFYSFGDAMLIE